MTTPTAWAAARQAARVAAPIFRDFMIAALKDEPATEFRIPPGLRIYRVSAADRPAACPATSRRSDEAYKPGTEPGKQPDLGSQAAAGEDAAPVAASGEDDAGTAPPPPPTAAARGAPASGTGGLY